MSPLWPYEVDSDGFHLTDEKGEIECKKLDPKPILVRDRPRPPPTRPSPVGGVFCLAFIRLAEHEPP